MIARKLVTTAIEETWSERCSTLFLRETYGEGYGVPKKGHVWLEDVKSLIEL